MVQMLSIIIDNKLSLRIYTYLMIGSGIGSVDSLYCYIITYAVIFDIFNLDVIES